MPIYYRALRPIGNLPAESRWTYRRRLSHRAAPPTPSIDLGPQWPRVQAQDTSCGPLSWTFGDLQSPDANYTWYQNGTPGYGFPQCLNTSDYRLYVPDSYTITNINVTAKALASAYTPGGPFALVLYYQLIIAGTPISGFRQPTPLYMATSLTDHVANGTPAQWGAPGLTGSQLSTVDFGIRVRSYAYLPAAGSITASLDTLAVTITAA